MQEFESKRNALFACLDDASNELKGTLLDQSNSSTALRENEHGDLEMNYRLGTGTRSQKKLHQLRGKESIFKKPELPIARCLKPRKIPDYQINPHKWKKYSLEDVDISDQTNSSAAFAFLKEIDERKDAQESSDNPETTKIEFKKSSIIRRNLKSVQSLEQMDTEIDSPKQKGAKLVMPEYVVGQKKASPFRKKSTHLSSTNNEKRERAIGKLFLSHLQEDNEDET